MDEDEECTVLLATGCVKDKVDTLLRFATLYRQNMSSDNVLKNRKLGTRTLVRIASRLARFPWDDDLYGLISRSLLAEFLPATERMNLEVLFDDCKIRKAAPMVILTPY